MSLVVVALAFTLTTTAFAVDTLTTLYKFKGKSDGEYPQSGLTADSAGNLYGTTVNGGTSCTGLLTCGVVFKLSPSSSGTWTQTVLYTFLGGTDGAYPESAPIFDAAGNLYGTTEAGGGSTNCTYGCGTIYELSPNSSGGYTETILYVFQGPNDAYGAGNANLMFDSAGNLYGSTFSGGNGFGSIYKLSPSASGWTYTTLYALTSTNGVYITGTVLMDAAGNFYGTTEEGGYRSGFCGTSGCGVVFRIANTATGYRFDTLFAFRGVNGLQPYGGVAMDATGNLYGTTLFGGAGKTVEGYGVVYKLTPTTQGQWKETILHAFTNGTDGTEPHGRLILDSAGVIYGTSSTTAFRVNQASSGGWQFEVLAPMASGTSNYFVINPLLRDAAGNMYGLTESGGSTLCAHGCGTIYELSPMTKAASKP